MAYRHVPIVLVVVVLLPRWSWRRLSRMEEAEKTVDSDDDDEDEKDRRRG